MGLAELPLNCKLRCLLVLASFSEALDWSSASKSSFEAEADGSSSLEAEGADSESNVTRPTAGEVGAETELTGSSLFVPSAECLRTESGFLAAQEGLVLGLLLVLSVASATASGAGVIVTESALDALLPIVTSRRLLGRSAIKYSTR